VAGGRRKVLPYPDFQRKQNPALALSSRLRLLCFNLRGCHDDITTTLSPTDPACRCVSGILRICRLPARADRCEDIANQLKGQVDNLKVGITAANMIYLSHPMAKEMSLGCKNRKYSNELYVKGNSRKPKPEFIAFVAGAAAIVFTLPKDELLKGVSSCFFADGHFPRRRRLDPLPPSRHELHADQG